MLNRTVGAFLVSRERAGHASHVIREHDLGFDDLVPSRERLFIARGRDFALILKTGDS